MDANVEQPLPAPEVVAFRHYYNDLMRFAFRPVDLAESLFSAGIISREVKDTVTSTSAGMDPGLVNPLDDFEDTLVQSSQPRATLRRLARAYEQAGFTSTYTKRMERFADSECTISLINPR